MKVTYKALLDVYTEIEENMVSEERSYRVYYAKEAMKNQVRAYYLESKWFHQKHTPTMEEYMAVALVTSAYAMLAATSFVGMGHVVTKDSFDWMLNLARVIDVVYKDEDGYTNAGTALKDLVSALLIDHVTM
ncbi:hypothetical protein POTOM_006712 [Populus tomentosa]|uniref:Terpene synthase metal-binding domain-containing protein n=1 Tax=Populus tomentosa TaxID=118781 RepID=A0A8X8APD8_POPTO|nr:hypothetical protein POTOM_006712 [Populus tomentosa]